jgi:hypothetical protein
MLKFFGFAAMALVMAQPALAGGDGSLKKDRKICKQVQETGSRMGNLKACMTKSQWEDYYRDTKVDEGGERITREIGGTNALGSSSPQ